MDNPTRLNENFHVLGRSMEHLRDLRDEAVRKGETRMEWSDDIEVQECEWNDIQEKWNELEKKKERGFVIKVSNSTRNLNNKVNDCLRAVKILIGRAYENSQRIEMFMTVASKVKALRFSHGELKNFTSDFKFPVGSGLFSNVYKGKLLDGVEVAVKVLKKESLMDVLEKQFIAEVSTMGKTYHGNLIKLYGYCFDAKIKALVYEYMENGSLEMILSKDHPSVSWKKLYGIAIGTAKGLCYLHECCNERIIHHDLKPADVLLDLNYNPKVSDFGFAKLYNLEKSHLTVSEFKGTHGYASPEVYGKAPKITYKCDVFSFGMMLFELFRQKNSEEENPFPRQVWEKFEKGQLDDIIKENGRENDKEDAETLCIAALWCIQNAPRDRPKMSTIWKVLEGEIKLPNPPQPLWSAIYSGRGHASSRTSS